MEQEIKEKIKYIAKKDPGKMVEFIEHVYKKDPEALEHMLDFPENMKHITTKGKYNELIEEVKWADGTKRGAKWNIDDIKRYAKVDFENADFTLYDYAYLVNVLYAKCCKYIQDASIYLKLAKCLLEDEDEETKLHQGAFMPKKHLKKQGLQAFYDEYDRFDEEDRRGTRRYRNSMNNYEEDRFYNYDIEDRRRYRNRFDDYPASNSYYKDSNMGFRR